MKQRTALTLAAALVASLTGLYAAEAQSPPKPRTRFLPDQTWPDNNGTHQ